MCKKNSIVIIGAGMMGTAVAAAHIRSGIPVMLYDNFPAALETAAERIAKELQLQDAGFDNSLLTLCSVAESLNTCGILIETVPEKINLKRKLYQKLMENRHNADIPFLFTNTSAISITTLAEGLVPVWQKRFCGLHFFHPVRLNSVVEIIAGKLTAPESVEVAKQHALSIGKQPIVVGDSPGFLVNRILNPYLANALILLEQGVEMQRIEDAAVKFGMRMGPFRIMDEIGLDVVLHAGWVLHKAFPERIPYSPLLLELVHQQRLGRKTGRGFMLYPNKNSWDGSGIPDPELLLSNRNTGTTISDNEIVELLIGSMFEEAERCFQDGIITDLSDAKFAMANALGFPKEKFSFTRITPQQITLPQKLRENRTLPDDELKTLFETSSFDAELASLADSTRKEYYGRDVYLRGLIEFTNCCKNNCLYCGIRCGNTKLERYRLTEEQIYSCCKTGYELGYRTFVLQGGEDAFYDDEMLCRIVSTIRKDYPDCAITLSLGERTAESYQKLFDAGANRYLLRHETANAEHYGKLHPPSMSLQNRKECLFNLKRIGYQTGSGFMVGTPFQTTENLVEDLRFLQELHPDMIGIGPFIAHHDTPFKNYPNGTLRLTLRLISVLRLMFPNVLLPATTALGTIAPDGREWGLRCGANVVMPNLSPVDVRKKYELYDNKICTGEEAAECRSCLARRVAGAGYEIVTDIGNVRPR